MAELADKVSIGEVVDNDEIFLTNVGEELETIGATVKDAIKGKEYVGDELNSMSMEDINAAIDLNSEFNFYVKDSEVVINTLCENPHVYTIDNFVTDEECEHFINLAKPNLQQALVSSNQKGFVSGGRTGKNHWIHHNRDITTETVGERIAAQVGVPLKTAEQYQVIYYDKTEEYRQHYDSWDHDGSEKAKRCMRYGGQRLYTALCYLNDVEEGGHTRFTKLNINVEAKKGRLLVFENVYKNGNKKHMLSEHAGTPVIKGEKWAFNLWFREKPRSEVVYNPDNGEKAIERKLELENLSPIQSNKSEIINRFSLKNEQNVYENVLNENEVTKLVDMSKFGDSEQPKITCWVKNVEIPELLNKIQGIVGIDKSHYENMNVIKYCAGFVHNSHFDAYDFSTEQGKKAMKTRGLEGQRVLTITGVLANSVEYNFAEHGKKIRLEEGSLLVYSNIIPGTDSRDVKMRKSIENINKDGDAIIFNIYIRLKNPRGVCLFEVRSRELEPKNVDEKKVVEDEDYMKTLELAYEHILTNKKRNCYKSLTILNKINWDEVNKTLSQLNELRDPTFGILNSALLENEYHLDEYNPVIQNDVINIEALKVVQDYIRGGIERNEIDLGDRQSNRYKARNETVTRFLHYEILPLIRKITGKKVRPTYTYLSCYTKDSDLPPHTDQADCEFTVSFIIEKPEGAHWPIYVDKTKQPVKYKGRYHEKPAKEKCVSCDCNSNGLMIFSGIDHIHYREALEYDFYNIVLLHYRFN